MSGTVKGGKAAAITNKARHGVNFYAKIALEGQKAWERNGRKPRGFAYDRDLASRAGKIGGEKSRRGKKQ